MGEVQNPIMYSNVHLPQNTLGNVTQVRDPHSVVQWRYYPLGSESVEFGTCSLTFRKEHLTVLQGQIVDQSRFQKERISKLIASIGLLNNLEDRGSTFDRKVGGHLPDYTASHWKRQKS
jgi:hypothetical protein